MSSFRGTWKRATTCLEGRSPPTWLLGVLVAALAWSPSLLTPGPGLDPSWWAGLYIAAKHQMQFGQEIVFTYGPLGFLKAAWLFYVDLALVAFAYSALLFVSFCTGLVWALRRLAGAAAALVLAYLVVALVPGIEQWLALVVLVSIGILGRRPDDRQLFALAIAGGIWAAIEALTKLSIGPLAIVLILIALIGVKARRGQLVAFLVSLFIAFFVLWIAAGQSIPALPDFAVNSIRVVSGYTEGMATLDGSRWQALMLGLIIIASVAWTWFGRFPDRRSQIAATVIVLLVGFSFFKQAVVRPDVNHVAIFLATMVIVWSAVPVHRQRTLFSVAGIALLSLLAIREMDVPVSYRINPVHGTGRLADTTRFAFNREALDYTVASARIASALTYGIDQRLTDSLAGRGVSVEPWETGAVWAYGFDWSPVPVFQNYAAYTPALDDLNASEIKSADGPERILRQAGGGSIDDRRMVWDAPAQAIATLCHFRPVAVQEQWEVLGRIPDRCERPVPAGEAEAGEGEPVPVPRPAADEVVGVKISGAGVTGLEKIRTLIFRPEARFIQTSDGAKVRFVAAVAGQGLLVDAGRTLRAPFGGGAPIPDTRTIAVVGAGDDLRFEFFRIKVNPS